MAKIPFAPPPGLFTDDTEFSSGGRWVNGSNVRFWNKRPQVIGGWQKRIATSITGSTYKSDIREWKSSAGTSYVAYGPANGLKVETGAALFDVTPTGTFTTAQWVFANWGDTLLANVSGAKLYQWSLNTSVVAAEITQSPDNITCILVTPERQVLALGCNEEVSGTFNGRCIRGCDLEDLTNWTTSATNNAFEHILDGATSSIVTAKNIGAYVAVWTETELFMGQFLGDPAQTYRFDRVASNCGALGRRAVVVVDQIAYWISGDLQVHRWTPGGPVEAISCSVIDFMRSSLLTASKGDTFAAHVGKYDEVWFNFVQTVSPVFSGSYIAFSINEGTWFKGSTMRKAMVQGLSNVIAVEHGGDLLNCETGQYGDNTGASGGTLSWSLESSDYYLSEGNARMLIRGVWPDFEDQAGSVSLQMKSRQYPQGAETSHTAQTLTTATTKKDFRASGKLFRIVLSGSDLETNTDTYMRYGKLLFDVVPLGER